ncbi:MAG: L-threonylcarbamoyladenylate synthase [Candidatus Neomarinimicrobiota bacterium]|nr:L-threonylcarbamoyladenylate synthase [Candidatus Neomarinimicrobiota bacterium]
MIYPATDQYIELAYDALNNGEIIVYPTDTLYGFGVDATNTKAIQNLNRLKGRVQPLSIIINTIEEISNFSKINESLLNEIKKYFPGKYTALLNAKKHNLSPLIQNGSTKIGLRIPNHSFPIKLTKLLKKPIVTTSINRHGNEALNDVTQVEIDFPNIDIFEDVNHNPSKGSTIIDFSQTPYQVIRKGDGIFPL